MSAKRSKYDITTKPLKIMTPVGLFEWPTLNVPDRTNKPEGEYSVDLRLVKDAPGITAFLETVEAQVTLAKSDLKKAGATKAELEAFRSPVKPAQDYDPDTKTKSLSETDVVLRAKTKATVNGEERRPTVIDSKKNRIPPTTPIGRGTYGRLGVTMLPYAASAANIGLGLTVYLDVAQIKTLGQGGSDPESFGMDELEDGFTVAPEGAPAGADFE